jgi:hypothetical protein
MVGKSRADERKVADGEVTDYVGDDYAWISVSSEEDTAHGQISMSKLRGYTLWHARTVPGVGMPIRSWRGRATAQRSVLRARAYWGLGTLVSALSEDAAAAGLPVSSAARCSIFTRAMRGPSISTTVRI